MIDCELHFYKGQSKQFCFPCKNIFTQILKFHVGFLKVKTVINIVICLELCGNSS